MIHQILNELNANNSSNYKLQTLIDYKENENLKTVLQLAYDRVKYTYGVKKIPYYQQGIVKYSLNDALNFLTQKLVTRELTGNAAIESLKELLSGLSVNDAELIVKIIRRDLRINLGTTAINKVWKNLITDVPYMRCGVYNEKTEKNIKYPAIVQTKADGMYDAVTVEDGNVAFTTRSGDIRYFPNLELEFKNLPDGVYIGELLVKNENNRARANGLINSDNPPHDLIYMQLWDLINLDEYFDARHTNKNITRLDYRTRFNKLNTILLEYSYATHNIHLIDFKIVNDLNEALDFTSNQWKLGMEGAILKDYGNIFKDHTSLTQLKLKPEAEIEVRITGFIDGTPGTKREKTFGSMMYQTDDGKIVGSVSGFSDDQILLYNDMKNELIGKVISIKFTDITRPKNSETYATMNPRFSELRSDKNTTDTLESAQMILSSAKGLNS